MNTWIVCHRNFDHGSVALFGFTSTQRAHLHAARLILAELDILCDLDGEIGRQLTTALHEGRYEDAVRLYHEVEGNVDCIDVTCIEPDQFHNDGPVEVPACG